MINYTTKLQENKEHQKILSRASLKLHVEDILKKIENGRYLDKFSIVSEPSIFISTQEQIEYIEKLFADNNIKVFYNGQSRFGLVFSFTKPSILTRIFGV